MGLQKDILCGVAAFQIADHPRIGGVGHASHQDDRRRAPDRGQPDRYLEFRILLALMDLENFVPLGLVSIQSHRKTVHLSHQEVEIQRIEGTGLRPRFVSVIPWAAQRIWEISARVSGSSL
jgi:hypothetical protein